PRSLGGESVWENVVTSCAPCNLRKGNRLLHEVKMELRHSPRPPAPVLFISLATPKIPSRWERYLGAYGGSALPPAPRPPRPPPDHEPGSSRPSRPARCRRWSVTHAAPPEPQ